MMIVDQTDLASAMDASNTVEGMVKTTGVLEMRGAEEQKEILDCKAMLG